jgi:hypothetical protein
VFIASPILIYLGVGTARREMEEAEERKERPAPKQAQAQKPAREPRPVTPR